MQDLAKRLEKEPREEAKKDVEHKIHSLSCEFERLDALQRRAVAATGELREFNEEQEDFDNIDDEVLTVDSSLQEDALGPDETGGRIVPERRPLHIPSTCLTQEHPLSKLELVLRKQQANRYVIALREVIAEKSFQFTHIIRVAPRKSVVTRARNTILKLNYQIAYYSKVYNRCRAALLRLAADEDTMDLYRKLTPQDVKASSAVVDPNSPGSTTLSLSWIWQTSTAGVLTAGAPAAGASSAKLRECKQQ